MTTNSITDEVIKKDLVEISKPAENGTWRGLRVPSKHHLVHINAPQLLSDL